MTLASIRRFPGTSFQRKNPERREFAGRSVCRYCGKKELVWEKHDNRWTLVDLGGKPHVCEKEKK